MKTTKKTAPRSDLYDAVVADAKSRCASRVLEAARMKGLMALLQPSLAAIGAAGLDVRPSDLFEFSMGGRRGIHLTVETDEKRRRLYAVLVSEGLCETERWGGISGGGCIVTLERGELVVVMCFVGGESEAPAKGGEACA